MTTKRITDTDIFAKNTATRHKKGRTEIKCIKGLWSVDAPTKEQAEAEAGNYFMQYFEDGEYDDLRII